MGSKVKMDTATRQKCNKIIASAAAAAGLAGAAPIPLADTIPITAAQVGMVIALGKVFDLTISESAAKSVLSIMTAQTVGRAVFANVIKAIPGAGAIVGGVVASATAGAVTTALGKEIKEGGSLVQKIFIRFQSVNSLIIYLRLQRTSENCFPKII